MDGGLSIAASTTHNTIHIWVWRRAVVVNGGAWPLDFGSTCLMRIIPFPDVIPTSAPFLVQDKPNDGNDGD